MTDALDLTADRLQLAEILRYGQVDKSKAKHFFDFVGPIAFDATLQSQVSSAAKDGRFADMPAPFRLKTSPGMSYGLQLVVLPLPNAQHFLLKHIIFPDQVKAEFVSTLCHGEVHTVSWQANAKNTKKAIQYMLEKMGGFQVQSFALQASGNGGMQSDNKNNNFFQGLTEENIDQGFDFIEAHGPRTHHSNTQLRWISKQFISDESPIQTWPERLIKEALRNLMNDGVLALPVYDFPLTLVDVEPSVLTVLEEIFPCFTDKACGMHGVHNVGKTPLGRTIAMAMSRYWVQKLNSKNEPGFREACEFDFFRGEAGRQDRPDIFDDGSLAEQPMRKLKGFCDVGNTVLTKERWGAAKFPQGQLRLYMSNDIDLAAEPSFENAGYSISHQQFMQMVEPAWMKGSSISDVMAVMKRTCVLLITNDFLYWRLPSEKEVRVERKRLDESKSLLRSSGGLKYMQYRKGDRSAPADLDLHLRWERAWMTSIMENKAPSCRACSILYFSISAPPAPALIKKEPNVFARKLSAMHLTVIDLESPPKKKLKASALASPAETEMEEMDVASEEDVFDHGGDLQRNSGDEAE
ncbi:unnamed protein product [Effrenium voratum]|nr:unnamed protein product [Effrenium voratum]